MFAIFAKYLLIVQLSLNKQLFYSSVYSFYIPQSHDLFIILYSWILLASFSMNDFTR